MVQLSKRQTQLGFVGISLLISIAFNAYFASQNGESIVEILTDWHIILFVSTVIYVFANLIRLLWNYRHKAEKTYHYINNTFNDKNSGFNNG